MSSPISFKVVNNYNESVLEILEHSEGQDLTLEITNTSGSDLQLAKPTSNEAGPADHHFALMFKPGVLSHQTTSPLRVTGDEWVIAEPPPKDGFVSLYLLGKSGATLAPHKSLSLTLEHVSAEGGARATSVELKCGPNLKNPSGGSVEPGSAEQHLNIVNASGRKDTPLHVGFVGSNTILNDGHTANVQVLRITNLLKTGSLPLTTGQRVSTFVLSFDVYDPREQNEWALGDTASVQDIKVEAVKIQNGQLDENWHIQKETQGETPEWIITPQNKTELKAGENIVLRLSNIRTGIRTGPANVYLRYKNISGYWDGQFVTSLEKSHLIQVDQPDWLTKRESFVGIGTLEPKAQLDVVGVANIRADKGYAVPEGKMAPGSLTIGSVTRNYGGGSNWNNNNPAGLLLETLDNTEIAVHDSNRRLASLMYYEGGEVNRLTIGRPMDPGWGALSTLSLNGNVGIGTSDPKAKLQVEGDAVFDGSVGIGTDTPANKLSITGNADLTGNLGIGTATPANKLSVAGNADFSGNVGIGTTNPTRGKIEIIGSLPNTLANFGFLQPKTVLSTVTNVNNNQVYNGRAYIPVGVTNFSTPVTLSLYADQAIAATNFYAFSDARIKRIRGRSDSARDLAILMNMEVTDYSYVDTLSKGEGPQKKVIGQQVEKVFPQAVSKQTDVIPDIYQPAHFKDGWVELATDLKKGDRVRLISEKGEGVYEVLEVTQDMFRTDFKPAGDKVFVFGREVNDFRNVNYDAIAMLNVSATQQLKKEKDEEVKALWAENAKLKATNDALTKRLQLLESKMETVPSVTAAKKGSNGNGRH